jgi:hypothetical protein
MAVRSMETADTAMETDGDGSGGTSPSRQGAGTETSVPRNSASTATALRNCSGNFADSFRVFRPEALYRRRSIVRGCQGLLIHRGRGQGLGRAALVCGWPLAPLQLSFGPRPSSGKNRSSGTCFVQFLEYFLCNFSEIQK